jgi:hypothetical protein
MIACLAGSNTNSIRTSLPPGVRGRSSFRLWILLLYSRSTSGRPSSGPRSASSSSASSTLSAASGALAQGQEPVIHRLQKQDLPPHGPQYNESLYWAGAHQARRPFRGAGAACFRRHAAEISVPRDWGSSFEPKIVAKRQRPLTRVGDMVISLSAKGLTHAEISAHLAEVCRQTITAITDRVMEGMAEWQARPLDPASAVIFIDAIHVTVREGPVASHAACLAPASRRTGADVPGLWAGEHGDVGSSTPSLGSGSYRDLEQCPASPRDAGSPRLPGRAGDLRLLPEAHGAEAGVVAEVEDRCPEASRHRPVPPSPAR